MLEPMVVSLLLIIVTLVIIVVAVVLNIYEEVKTIKENTVYQLPKE